MYPDVPRTQVIVGSMNMGYISDTAMDRTQDLFRPKREPIPIGYSDGRQVLIDLGLVRLSCRRSTDLKLWIEARSAANAAKLVRISSRIMISLTTLAFREYSLDGRKDQTLTQVFGIGTTTTEIPPRKNTNIIAEPEPVSTHF